MSDEEQYDPHFHIDRAMAILDTAGKPSNFSEKMELAQTHAAIAKSLQDVPYANDEDIRSATELGRHEFATHNLYSVTFGFGRGMRVAQSGDEHDRPYLFDLSPYGVSEDPDDDIAQAVAILEENGWEIVSPFMIRGDGATGIVRATPEWLTRG